MSGIYIDIKGIRNTNYNVPCISAEIGRTNKLLGMFRYKIAKEIAVRKRIGQRLAEVCNEMSRLERQINELYNITNSCVAQYEAAEYENFHNAEQFQ